MFTNLRDVGQRIRDFTVGEDKIVLTKLLSNISYTGTNPMSDKYIQFVTGTGSNANSIFLQIDRDGSLGSAIFKNFLQVDNITTTELQQVALSEVHLVRARCPHHKSFIINICTS